METGNFKKVSTWLLIIFGVLIIASALSPKTPENKQPVKSDKELFMMYYNNLLAKTEEADRLFEPFAQALRNSDFISATQIALRIKQPIGFLWGDISKIETPALQNQEAKMQLDQAQTALSGAYLYRSTMVRDFIKFAESQNIKKMAELKTTAENIQTLTIGGTAYLMDSGRLVGVKLAELNK